MGDPRNPGRQREEWDTARLYELGREIATLPNYAILSGGWAWHFMSPPHREYKILHDHKDVDIFISPESMGDAVSHLKMCGYQRIWTRFDKVSADKFTRFEKHTPGGVKVLLDVFLESPPFIEVGGYKVVEPRTLLSYYGEIHSTEDCVAVLAAKKLLDKNLPVVGSEELVNPPWKSVKAK